jgi:murein DD-endopeptidase MepM/ murein hydrolase activator NlpD
MARTYLVRKGDTLARIARRELGDAGAWRVIADFNGLPSPDQIAVGQLISLPSRRDLQPSPQAPRNAPPPPHGYEAICDTFGDIRRYIGDDGRLSPRWESEHIARAALPFPVPLAWDTTKAVTAVACHRLIAPLVEEVFGEIAARGLQRAVKTFGGGYAYRAKRGALKPSTHAWGIAIDLNPATNAMGTAGDMDPRLVMVFEASGFLWGGRWAGRGRDPMHFQYCTGY